MTKKCILLFSGGLDSFIAYHLLKQQNIDLIILKFTSVFLQGQDIKTPQDCRIIDEEFGEEYLGLIKNPDYGFGRNMNPCIDCRIFMLKKAKQFMKKEKAGFIATGEVLGQRHKSQKKQIFDLIEKKTGLKGLILRPLSASLLGPTYPENKGIVDRDRLLNIQGKSRREQLRLADYFGIKGYTTPSGGCLLTDKGFSRRLKDLMRFKPDFGLKDTELLKIGRHFRINPACKFIIGRTKEESAKLTGLKNGHILVKTQGYVHPAGLAVGRPGREMERILDIFSYFAYKVSKQNALVFEIINKDKALRRVKQHCRQCLSLPSL